MTDPEPRFSWGEDARDLLLGAACAAVAVAVHLGGSEAVSRNLDPSWFSVLLTLLAVGPLVVRHRFPVTVLALTLSGLVLLVATRNTVGVATLGCTIAFYTAVATGPRRRMQISVAVMFVGVVVGLLLRPVDLSRGGALITLVIFTAAGVLAGGVRQRRERFESEVVSAQERAARSAMEERMRITRELHDVVGHALSVMVVQAGVAERLLQADPQRAQSAIAEVGATGRASLAEMRQVLGALRDGDLDPSLPRDPTPTLAQVPELVARVEAAGLPMTSTVQGEPTSLPQGLELAAYRVIQEALTNCLKHASARHATVTLRYTADALAVTVTDDGTARPRSGPAGQGLAGMKERVLVYGGDLVAGPSEAGGFRVHARIPLPTAVPVSGAPTGPPASDP